VAEPVLSPEWFVFEAASAELVAEERAVSVAPVVLPELQEQVEALHKVLA